MMEIFRNVPQVLWIRVGALGDLLISTAALEKTFERFPDSQIWILGEKFWIELLEPKIWPRLNGILVREKNNLGQMYVPDSPHSWKKHGSPTSLRKFYSNCQATVNLRIESYRFAWGPWLARVPIRIGSCPWPMKWLYTHWSPWLGKEPPIHERDWYVNVVEAPKRADIPAQERPKTGLPKLKTPNPNTIGRLLSNSQSDSHPNSELKNYILINPTASRIEKAWPPEKFRELCGMLAPECKRLNLQLFIIGAPTETNWLNKVARDEFKVIQPTTLGELIDVVAGANILVANTSSVQFIAATTGTPTLTLMGRSSPIRWGPVGAQDVVVQGKIPEAGTSDLFREEQQAYESITVEQVLKAARDLVKVTAR